MKPILVSGLKPEGHQHLGNYLGTLKNLVNLQNSGKYECYFFIADLHSLTEEFDPGKKSGQITELMAEYLAAGLDPKKSTIFSQSTIPAHSELMWLLSAISPEGELRRMTQYKDKVVVKKLDANIGLLLYPVLMAADILLYDAQFVPVGDDQLQHIELARTLARKFNAKFGDTFMEPKALLTKTPRVMSLKNPEKKMSKSDPASCLFIDDSPEEIKTKISRATTDSDSKISYDPKKKPGLANLLEIYAALSEKEPAAAAKELSGKDYSTFKSLLSNLVSDYFADFRKKKKGLLAAPDSLLAVLKSGSEKAAKIAEKKLAEVKKKIGIAL
ncbi:MAG: tryptophan--tRNA ligase [Candidatus Liptonbacteria bacterium]|nr:tryptophan--tRNA ligase [Candidatus Liptonbacteria bacterium]